MRIQTLSFKEYFKRIILILDSYGSYYTFIKEDINQFQINHN